MNWKVPQRSSLPALRSMSSEGAGERVAVRVLFRGAQIDVSLAAGASLSELGAALASATGADAASLRLLLPGRALALGDAAAATRSLADAGLAQTQASSKRLLLLGALASELQAGPPVDAALRIAPPEHAAAVAARRRSRAPAALVLPPGPYTFASFRALQGALTPSPAHALRLLHRLACDAGIVAVMAQRRWRVGLLSEMPPEGKVRGRAGHWTLSALERQLLVASRTPCHITESFSLKVGVSASCVLGYNINAGQEIALRLRTDDLRGFRGYARIRETLIHELTHIVWSEHDLRFKALNSELTVAAARADWTRGAARTLGGGGAVDAWDVPDDDEEEDAPAQPVSRPLGGAARDGRSAHEAAAAAAERRAAQAAAEAAEAAMAAEAATALANARAAEAEEEAEAAAEAADMAAEADDSMDVQAPPPQEEAASQEQQAPAPRAAEAPVDLDVELSRLAAGADAARSRAAAAAAALASGGSGAPARGEAAAVALRTCASVLRNALAHPDTPRFRLLPRRGGGVFEARAGRFAAARDLLHAAGFVEEAEPGRAGGTRLRLARDDPALLWLALDAVNEALAMQQPLQVGGA